MSQLVQQNNITDLIKSQMPAIALVMNGTSERERKIKAERFARICLTAVRKNPKLMKCSQESFAAALMNCAQLNLEPNTPQELAYLIPYKDECQFQIGYKGFLQLVYRSGIVSSFNADVVYRAEVENGMFEYRKGITPTITHKVDLLHPEAREGELIAAYAACTLKGVRGCFDLLIKRTSSAHKRLAPVSPRTKSMERTARGFLLQKPCG